MVPDAAARRLPGAAKRLGCRRLGVDLRAGVFLPVRSGLADLLSESAEELQEPPGPRRAHRLPIGAHGPYELRGELGDGRQVGGGNRRRDDTNPFVGRHGDIRANSPTTPHHSAAAAARWGRVIRRRKRQVSGVEGIRPDAFWGILCVPKWQNAGWGSLSAGVAEFGDDAGSRPQVASVSRTDARFQPPGGAVSL